MGCNCNKKGGEIEVTNVTIVPAIEEPKQEENDWYNNIDTIEPIKPKDNE